MLTTIDNAIAALNQFLWGYPLLILLVGGGLFFMIYSRGLPYKHFFHALALLSGKYDREDDQGELTHFQALSAALSATMGLGNVAGVAMAITAGGPGAIFWMWVTAVIGVATKFFTCSLGVMYRGYDSNGKLQGGPMYVIREGLNKRWHSLAILFSAAGLFGVIPLFQANQLTEAIREHFLPAIGVGDSPWNNLSIGILLAIVVSFVIYGGLQRIASLAVRLVPSMTLLYMLMTAFIFTQHIGEISQIISPIFIEAFKPEAIGGGLLGIIIIGVSRGAFSNEAGIGTEVMAHGAAKTNEPIREGLVGMLGPVIDTLIVCSCTAFAILASGVWQDAEGIKGIGLTLTAYQIEAGTVGQLLLGLQILFLSLTTMITFWYYGTKCISYLFGANRQHWYTYIHISVIVIGAVTTSNIAFNVISTAYALMAIPTMISSIILAPKVMHAARKYFSKELS